MDNTPDTQRFQVFSTLAHRRTIGLLGMALPFVLSLGTWLIGEGGLRSSISDYYHTGMRDVLVGTLFAIGFFLLSYRGHGLFDDIAGHLACVFAVGVALFPVEYDKAPGPHAHLFGQIHLACATLLFLTLVVFSLFLFTKTHRDKEPTRGKRKRNRVYRLCGLTMLVCIALIALYYYKVPWDTREQLDAEYAPVYWLESLAILAFGISWFTKSEAVLKDVA